MDDAARRVSTRCRGDEIRALRRLQREQGLSSHVFMTERDSHCSKCSGPVGEQQP